MNLFFGARTKNVAFLFNQGTVFSFVPSLSAWEANDGSLSKLVVFESVNVDSVGVVERSIVFNNTDAVCTLEINNYSVLNQLNHTARTKYLLLWKPTFPNPCMIKDLPCIPGASPIISMYFFVLQKIWVPWKTPRPVAETRPCTPP